MCGKNYPYPETCPRATCCDLMREQERLSNQRILCEREYNRGFRNGFEIAREGYFSYGQPELDHPPTETIKIGELEYSKSEVEEALKDLVPIRVII